MDEQNFQNEQNGQTVEPATEPVVEPAAEPIVETAGANNNYQDSTQYTQNVYTDSAAEPVKEETPGLAIASLVMGIVSIVLSCCCGSGIVFGIAGIIMAIVANKKTKTGVGTAGLVCSIIGTVFSVIGLIYYIAVLALGIGESFY
jgi:hypothetical protein